MTRLQPITLRDFTGALNVRENAFQLADNESPAMLNVHVDSRVGFATRASWSRWNPQPIRDDNSDWDPRNSAVHQYSDGSFSVYVVEDNIVYRSFNAGNFVDTTIRGYCHPHQMDLALWGDVAYFATGALGSTRGTPAKMNQAGITTLAAAGDGSWNDDYTTAVHGRGVVSETCETHANYLFHAAVYETFDGVTKAYPNRIRWSHVGEPEDFAQADYLDIERGGSRITAIKSFTDHLLIFKDRGVWALFGYDADSWQLVEVSTESGTVAPTTVAASESVCYYYSPTGRSAVYVVVRAAAPESVSEPIRVVMSESTATDNIWLSWASNRLFVSMPWEFGALAPRVTPTGMDDPQPSPFGASSDKNTLFIYDATIGSGAWEAHTPAKGSIRTVVEIPGNKAPLGMLSDDNKNQCFMRFGGGSTDAVDMMDNPAVAYPFWTFYSTNWKDGGTEELRKSWRRPRFIVRNPAEALELRVDAFRDYDLATPYRSWVIGVSSRGKTFWRELGAADPAGDGFDWDDGSEWEGQTSGSRIVRGGPLGVARAIQLVITPIPTSEGKSWGIDALTLKYINRRFTT
jgi:hypothetical protein